MTTYALVTVDKHGHLTPESIVSVGEWTWPVPERCEKHGLALWMHRVGCTVRDYGWKLAGEARVSGEPGVYQVPVKPAETNET